jgi:hypothetical protein
MLIYGSLLFTSDGKKSMIIKTQETLLQRFQSTQSAISIMTPTLVNHDDSIIQSIKVRNFKSNLIKTTALALAHFPFTC